MQSESNRLLLESLASREAALGKNDTESMRTGQILSVLGNLYAAKGQWDESFEYHQRVRHQMRGTLRDRDFYIANGNHKVAEHLIRLGRKEEAM
jgi:hypothetical protein